MNAMMTKDDIDQKNQTIKMAKKNLQADGNESRTGDDIRKSFARLKMVRKIESQLEHK